MTKIDYFWPRTLLQVTGIIFVSQLLVELAEGRKPGFEWVIYACAGAHLLAWMYAATVISINARQELKD